MVGSYTFKVTSTRDPDNTFVKWLQDQLNEHDWTPQVLAAKAGVAQATLSNVINRKRAAGPELLRAIAKALDKSQVEVFKIAGLIDEELLDDEEALQETRRLLAKIDDDDELERTLDVIEVIAREAANRQKRIQKTQPKHAAKPNLAHDEP
jgi:transcriptional regulator with XRE-family HTH domain